MSLPVRPSSITIRHALGSLAAGLVLVLPACGAAPASEASAAEPASAESAAPITPTTAAPTTAAPTTSIAPEAAVDFSGTYAMLEFYDEDNGVFSAMTHELRLTAWNATGSYEGTLEQVEFDQDGVRYTRTVPIVGKRRGDTIEIVSVDGESADPYPLGTVLVRLAGTPDEPTTELVELVTLMPADRAPSLSFVPGSVAQFGLPAPGSTRTDD